MQVESFKSMESIRGYINTLTKTHHSWTNGQIERMNRPLKEATVRKYYYQIHQHVKAPLQAFQLAYNFSKRLKTLKGHTPYEYICQCWQKEPGRFTINLYHHTVGLNTYTLEWSQLRLQAERLLATLTMLRDRLLVFFDQPTS